MKDANEDAEEVSVNECGSGSEEIFVQPFEQTIHRCSGHSKMDHFFLVYPLLYKFKGIFFPLNQKLFSAL